VTDPHRTTTPRRLVLFAHYDAQGEVKRYIQHYLRALREVSSRIVFITTASLDDRSLAVAQRLTDQVLERRNIGFDFCMWRDALEVTDISAWDEIVLTNSSVFGPLFPLATAFQNMADQNVDMWSMTENHEIAWHLQSYFLVMRRSVHSSPAFAQFWSSVLPYRDKWQVVLSYEIGLSRWLLGNGYRLQSYTTTLLPSVEGKSLQPDRFAALRSARSNTTAHYPTELLQLGMPFVKVETLRENPCAVDLDLLGREMSAAGFDSSLLEFDRPVVERILHASHAPHGPKLRRRLRTFWEKISRIGRRFK